MLKTGTVAAILAFCSVSSAAPASQWGSDSWATTSTISPASGTATGGSVYETETASGYYNSLSYAHSGASYSTKAADASATGVASVAAGSASSAVATSTGTAPPATPTGLSKVQQILLSDTRADAINNVLTSDADFIFDFNKMRKFGPGQGGEIVQANRKLFPALTGTGIGMAVGFLEPCGFNTPHVHNRATELLIVTKGSVVSEMVIENGVNGADGAPRDIMNTVGELQATPYFMGALHTQFNPTCDNATFIAPLSSDDFGANTMAQAFLALQDETIAATAGNHISGADIDKFRGLVSTSVAMGVEQCLQTCNIPKRK
ncbi:RmlC-like cupin domain-containing protein [Annulohypoxylon bovei var. microspora]|nr:RmlC-like cupin domain-containing protein [Annulohypoxylon bovei var. microspora]